VAYEILVDPDQMVEVEYDDPRRGHVRLAAVACRYVPTLDRDGRRRVAMEVMIDPAQDHPVGAYYCPRGRLSRQLLAPSRVRGVRPYAA
jgi:hypothetical protein